MAGNARVVVISDDFNFRVSVADALRKDSRLAVAVAGDVFQGASMAKMTNMPAVLAVDTDALRVTDTYLKSLIAPDVHVVSVGRLHAATFMRSGITCILAKPLPDNQFSLNMFMQELRATIDMFMTRFSLAGRVTPASGGPMDNLGEPCGTRQKIIAIAASTGGTEALPVVLRDIPANSPPILIVQHMPPVFTTQFADRLNKLSKITVKEAVNGDYLRKGLALLAPGDYHMKLVRKGAGLAVENVMGEKVNAVRPAADVLYDSMVDIVGGNCVGVVLTGMGADGARGLKKLHDRGAVVLGQDEASSTVYGMPKAAYEMGAVDYQLPLNSIGQALTEFFA